MNKKIIALVVLSLLLGVAGFYYQRYKLAPKIVLPAMELKDLNGQSVSMNVYAGKPLFVSFFATWCGPCMREMPELAAMHELLSPYHLAIVAISDEPIEKLRGLQERIGNDVVILQSSNSLHDVGIYTFPTNYIFNAKSQKVYSQVKPEDWTDGAVVERVKDLIK